ncbi:MAG TPA: sialidase family protein [Acidimicrobiales bacterium]|nr:sialidase family protein [Acidimicrobiales bacterium]
MDRRVGMGLGMAGALAGLALVLFGLQGRDTSLERGPTQAVSDDPQLAINVNTSPVVATDPRRPDVLVAAGRVDAPRLDCKVLLSTTGGLAWRRLDLPPPPGETNCFWPAVAFDGDGNLLVLYTPTGGPFNLPTGLWLQRFTPEFTPDGAPLQVSGPLTFQPRLAVEGRRVLVMWIRASDVRATKFLGFGPPPNPIVLARSEDGGRTFAPPVTVSEPSRLAVQPTLLIGPGGQVVVGALDLADDRATYESAHGGQPGPPPSERWRVVAWTSSNGGASFGPATTVGTDVVPVQRVLIDLAPAPAFALDPARRRIHAAWESGHDVFVSRSEDGGATWSPPLRIGPETGGQFLPGIGIAPGGRVDVGFYDRSGDPEDVLAEVVLASSSDGGRSFPTTGVVSDRPFDSIVGSFNGDNVMLGSHLAVVSRPGRATLVWADTTRGNRVNNIVDLVSATVEIRPGRGARVPMVLGGLVLAAFGLGLTARSWPGRGPGRGRWPARRPTASPPPPLRG